MVCISIFCAKTLEIFSGLEDQHYFRKLKHRILNVEPWSWPTSVKILATGQLYSSAQQKIFEIFCMMLFDAFLLKWNWLICSNSSNKYLYCSSCINRYQNSQKPIVCSVFHCSNAMHVHTVTDIMHEVKKVCEFSTVQWRLAENWT